MIFGSWGTLGRFVLLTTGIGAVAALGLYLFNAPPSSFFELLEGLAYIFFFLVPGAALGLVIGVPAYGALRLCLRALPGRKSVLVFFFVLGVISALIGFAVVLLLTGGPSTYTFESQGDVVRTLGWPALTAGVLTAAASFLVVEPREESAEATPLSSNGKGHQ
ncbi:MULTISPECIES: hypothetical protein [Brevibacterium]|uniref:hypothetical protein n=1 Tax=Brevibacterium TaxID=1696 RepID=UPI000C45596B|nr:MULTISPECIES: hypothetical protein [Brevibacterium]SMX95589.1 hypothetical protein BSP239C_02653 [Brevibacterium sp. 239c]